MTKRLPVRVAILAGGSGTRFWPLGRSSRPKQLLALDGADRRSLLRLTVERVRPLSSSPPWIVAPRALARALAAELPELPARSFLWEPAPRNTAAAVALAALTASREAPGAVLLVVPADHHVAPVSRYRAALAAMASRAARSESILTLGLRPTSPATGYGWLAVGPRRERTRAGPIHLVTRYVEKPDLRTARRLLAGRRHLWNGGTFAFRPNEFLERCAEHLPEVARPLLRVAGDGRRPTAAALARAYAKIPSVSVDHGMMEKAAGIEVLASDVAWDDLGSFDAVARHLPTDARGNRVRGDVVLVDARECVVQAEGGLVALLGVEDLVVVRTADAVLVARRGRGEDVREVVARLRAARREDLLS